MKDCREIDNLLPGYLDNDLPPEEMKLVEEHLPACSRCREALADLRKTRGLLQDMQEVEPPAWFKQKIMSQVRKEAEGKKGIIERLFFPLHIKVPVQALATVLIAVLAFHVYKAGEPEVNRVAQIPLPSVELKKEQAPAEPPQKADAAAVKEEKKSAGSPSAERREEKKQLPEFAPAPRSDAEGVKLRDKAGSGIYGVSKQKSQPQPAPAGSEDKVKTAAEPEAGNRMFRYSEEKDATAAFGQRKKKAAEAGREISESKGESYAPSAAPRAMAKSAAAARHQLLLVMRVSDLDATSGEAAGVLRRYGTGTSSRQAGAQRMIITADIKSRLINDAIEKLKPLGSLRVIGSIPEAPETTVTVKIEIIATD